MTGTVTGPPRVGPHFLGIGVQRAATGWIFNQLLNHPEIWLPPIKEIHYFDCIDPELMRADYRFRQNLARRVLGSASALAPILVPQSFRKKTHTRWDPLWDATYFAGPTSMDWYMGLFRSAAEKGSTTGEITPEYSMLSSPVIRCIKNALPDLRVFLIFRDPIDRAWSNFQLVSRHRRRREKLSPQQYRAMFDEFLVNPVHLVRQRTDYAQALTRWRAEFGAEQIHVAYYEDFVRDSATFLGDILRHIGVAPQTVAANGAMRINSHSSEAIPAEYGVKLADLALPYLKRFAEIEPNNHVMRWLAHASELGRRTA